MEREGKWNGKGMEREWTVNTNFALDSVWKGNGQGMEGSGKGMEGSGQGTTWSGQEMELKLQGVGRERTGNG